MHRKYFILPLVLVVSHVLNRWPNSFPRNENQNPDLFWSGMLLTAFAALATLTKSEKEVVMSRDQTNEWKGFMQITFILYHYYRATYVYNEIRVFVSCYVWMSGFGNYLYFTKKNDKKFINDWSCAVKKEYPNFMSVGEEYPKFPHAATLSYWQEGKKNYDNYTSCLPSVLDIALMESFNNSIKDPLISN